MVDLLVLVVDDAEASKFAGAGTSSPQWAWEHLQPWIDLRLELPIGPLLCVIKDRHEGDMVSGRRACRAAPHGHDRQRSPALAPHQLRHAHAVEMAHEGVPLIVIQRQLGHSNLGITSI